MLSAEVQDVTVTLENRQFHIKSKVNQTQFLSPRNFKYKTKIKIDQISRSGMSDSL